MNLISSRPKTYKWLTALLCMVLGIAFAEIGTAQERGPALSLPVDCEIGKQCLVQNYVDDDPGVGAKDYQCGFLTYDGHKGTDIRLVNVAVMNQGVRVLAAADGRVRAVRDGMADISIRVTGKETVAGKEAGNSVVLDHGNGWETQYGHLRNGSVMVKPGAAVKRGQPLGLIGMSGFTEFPHVHFEVRLNGKTVDPFVGAGERTECGASTNTLWTDEVLAKLKYTSTGVIDAGFAGVTPGLAGVSRGDVPAPVAASPVLLFWIHLYGAQVGDEEVIRVIAPGGQILAEKHAKVPRNKADWLSFVGKRRHDTSWPVGSYRGEYTLQRVGKNQVQQVIITWQSKIAI